MIWINLFCRIFVGFFTSFFSFSSIEDRSRLPSKSYKKSVFDIEILKRIFYLAPTLKILPKSYNKCLFISKLLANIVYKRNVMKVHQWWVRKILKKHRWRICLLSESLSLLRFYWQTETRFLASSQKGKNSFSIQNKNDRDANFWLNFQRRGMFQTLETQSESALVIRSIFPSPCLRRQPGLDGRRWISIYCKCYRPISSFNRNRYD